MGHENFIRELKLTYKCAVEEANKSLSLKTDIDRKNSEQCYTNLCLSIETYLLHLLHLPIFSHLSITYAHKDAEMNRKIR